MRRDACSRGSRYRKLKVPVRFRPEAIELLLPKLLAGILVRRRLCGRIASFHSRHDRLDIVLKVAHPVALRAIADLQDYAIPIAAVLDA
jgi:hypothetical protein